MVYLKHNSQTNPLRKQTGNHPNQQQAIQRSHSLNATPTKQNILSYKTAQCIYTMNHPTEISHLQITDKRIKKNL